MRGYWKFIVGTMLIGAVAFAVKENVDKVTSPNPQWFQKGIYVGTAAKNPASNTLNKVTNTSGAEYAWDFGSLSGSPSSLLPTCEATGRVTLTGGAAIGDNCDVQAFGIANADGGTALAYEVAAPRCHVIATNTAISVFCAAHMSDGGSVNIPDAGLRIRTWSNQ